MAKIEFSPAFAAGLPQRLAAINISLYAADAPSGVGFMSRSIDGVSSNNLIVFKIKL